MNNQSGKSTPRQRLNRMVEQLRDDIAVRGKYAPGQFLPSELALVKQYGLSNKTVRKGLEQLMAEGLIEKIPRVGSVVTDRANPKPATLMLGVMGSLERDMKLGAMLGGFSRLHPEVRIETVRIPSSGFADMAEPLLAEGVLDAFMINDELFWALTQNGDASPLAPLPRRDDVYPFLNESFTHNGELLAQPLLFSPVVLAYNKDHFREAGIPEPDGSWTWEDALRHGESLSLPPERFGLVFYPLSNNRWPLFLLQSGMPFAAKSGEPFRLEGTPLMDSIRLFKTLIRNRTVFPDFIAESSNDYIDLFRLGKASMTLATYMALNDFAFEDLNYDITPVPFMREPATLLTAIGIAVNKRSRNPEAAAKLAGYLASASSQRMIRNETLSIPAVKPIAEADPEEAGGLNRPRRFPMYRNIVPSFRRHRDLMLAPGAFGRLRELLKRYWSDLIDERSLCCELEQIVGRGSGQMREPTI
jgi:multiple sugar transport system substrate-binding protein